MIIRNVSLNKVNLKVKSDTRSVWCIPTFRMRHFGLSDNIFRAVGKKFRHFGRKIVNKHIDFPELPKSVYEGLKRFADSFINQSYT